MFNTFNTVIYYTPEQIRQVRKNANVTQAKFGKFVDEVSAGTVSRSSETITVVSGTALGAIAAPNPGWHFVKWIRLDASLLTSALMTASTTGFNDLPTDMTQLAFASIQNVTDGLWYGEIRVH